MKNATDVSCLLQMRAACEQSKRSVKRKPKGGFTECFTKGWRCICSGGLCGGKLKCHDSIEAFCEMQVSENYDERIDFYMLSENKALA